MIKYKKIFFILALTAGVSSFANVSKNNNRCAESGFSQGYETSKAQMRNGYNTPARINVEGSWDFFVTGSFIYFQPQERGLELGTVRSGNQEKLNTTPGELINAKLEYKSGFKVALGYNFDHDDWTGLIKYMWFHPTINTKKTDVANEIFISEWRPSRLNPASPIISTNSKWELDLDILDFELGRYNYTGRYLIFMPYSGLRGGWIDQKYVSIVTTRTNIDFPTTSKSDSWIIGPRVGIDTKWLLGSGFRFFGDISTSLFYQRYSKVKFIQSSNTNPSIPSINIKDKNNFINPNLDLTLGFGFGSYFNENNWNFDLLVGYEFHMFWNQNIMNQLKARTDLTNDAEAIKPANLMLHGLIASISFDF
ncbi:MAG: hypothetical protein JXA94_06010 [Parachlamydiales bacterium]|nr:hypothetical protein [Parachlamydiales bacterium]